MATAMQAQPAPLAPWHPAALLATWFGTGHLPWIPGSWASLAALPFAALIEHAFGRGGLALAAALLFVPGCWAAERFERASGLPDDRAIVVDEVAGQWLALVAAPLAPASYLLGFLLFRIFDIAKPWPVRWADRRLRGGFGVMADDILAGLYAAAVLALLEGLGRTFFGR